MWPKILTQLLPELIDMLPHVKRVIPMADQILASKVASDAAIASMAESVRADVGSFRTDLDSLRGELGKIYIVNAAVNQKLDDLTAEVKSTGEAADQSRAVTTALGHSIVAMERQIRALRSLLVATIVLIVVLILMSGWLLIAPAR